MGAWLWLAAEGCVELSGCEAERIESLVAGDGDEVREEFLEEAREEAWKDCLALISPAVIC